MNLYSEAAYIEFNDEPIGKLYFRRLFVGIIVIICFLVDHRDIFSRDLLSQYPPPRGREPD